MAVSVVQEPLQGEVAATPLPEPTPAPIVVPALSGDVRALGQQIIQSRGEDWAAADFIISHESGWNLYAVNPNGGACGLVQALPCSKVVWGDAAQQLNWFVNYCDSSYGSVYNEYLFWLSHNWY